MSFCVSVCLGCIFCKTAKQIQLKFCMATEVYPGHCVSHFGGNSASDLARGVENVPCGILCQSCTYQLCQGPTEHGGGVSTNVSASSHSS